MPFTVVASVLLMVLALDRFQSVSLWGNVVSRLDGLLLLLGFAAFMYYTFTVARQGEKRRFSERYGHWLSHSW